MNHEEQQYLQLMDRILRKGDPRMDRTGVGTHSLFGAMMRFDLSDSRIPIMTTKRVYWKAALRELLWFLSGETNIRPLLQQGVTIWTDWPLKTYREATGDGISQSDFEARILIDEAFARTWGDLGPVYGKQWRRWKGPDGREYDQIADLIASLKKTPASRRHIFHAWNVAELDQMALPPCHMVYQWHVSSDGRLSCLLFQRSADVFLGLSWNLLSLAILTHMIAQQTGLTPGEIVWTGGDVHLYTNHFAQAAEQITRTPRPFPKLDITRCPASIDDYRFEDFVVSEYDPYPAIQADVAV